MNHKENRRLISEWLGTDYQISLVEADIAAEAPPLWEPFDLAIIDGPSFKRVREAVLARKAAEGLVFLPILLVASRATPLIASQYLWDAVDDFITPLCGKWH